MYNYTHIRGKSDALSPMHMHTTLVTLVNRKEETDNKREIRKMEKKEKVLWTSHIFIHITQSRAAVLRDDFLKRFQIH